MDKIHDRLRAELASRGLSAAEAARQAGEDGSQGLRDVLAGRKRLSADLLAALTTGAGIDAVFVLTGSRSFAPPQTISAEHRALILDYDACSPGDQAALRRTAAAMASGGAGGRVRISVKGSVGQAVAGGKLVNKKPTAFNFGKEKK